LDLSALRPRQRPGENEPLAGPRDSDVGELPFLVHVAPLALDRLAGQEALLATDEKHHRPFELFGAVERHERHAARLAGLLVARVEGESREVAVEARGAVALRVRFEAAEH